MTRLLPTLALLLAASPALAAERRYSITEFDRIQIDGPVRVRVRTDVPNSATATGSAGALDRISVEVQGRTLRIRPNRSGGWGGYPGEAIGGVEIAVGARLLQGMTLTGNGSLDVDRVRGMRIQISLAGGGSLSVGEVAADQLVAALAGSGVVRLAGKAASLRMTAAGTGDVDAVALQAADAQIDSATSGTVMVAASRSARVLSTGSGDVIVSGKPACTVKQSGAGQVTCGTR